MGFRNVKVELTKYELSECEKLRSIKPLQFQGFKNAQEL